MKKLCCLLLLAGILAPAWLARSEVNTVETIADGVYFHEGDLGRKGHCNNGWVVFDDFVFVIDGNFPSGALEVIPKIRAVTDKPIRFAFDTHHHGDHAYGNQVWFEHGATPVAHEGVLAEMKRFETGLFGGPPGRWEAAAKDRRDVAASKLKAPVLLFRKEMIFDDGRHRVELHHFGVAHTRGDGFAWLPKERILFTGDACVNGPYNNAGDGSVIAWIKTLEGARALQPLVVCPGHGPRGGPEILERQHRFFIQMHREAKKLVDAGMTPAELKAATAMIRETIRRDENLALYVGGSFDGMVENVYRELRGGAVPK